MYERGYCSRKGFLSGCRGSLLLHTSPIFPDRRYQWWPLFTLSGGALYGIASLKHHQQQYIRTSSRIISTVLSVTRLLLPIPQFLQYDFCCTNKHVKRARKSPPAPQASGFFTYTNHVLQLFNNDVATGRHLVGDGPPVFGPGHLRFFCGFARGRVGLLQSRGV